MEQQTLMKRGKRVINLAGCGGVGTDCARRLVERLNDQPGLGHRVVDTSRPAWVSASRFTEIRPDFLPDRPDQKLLALLRESGVTPERYQLWKQFTGEAGVSRLPFLAYAAAMFQLDRYVSDLESDFRTLSASVGGADGSWLVTISSGLGGTGAPSSRVAGLAFRLAVNGMANDKRWLHLVVTSSLLADTMQGRMRALEHRHLIELRELMRPGATLSVPGRSTTIDRPGPDFVWLLGGSASAPRTVDEALDETAAILRNLITT